MFRSRLFKIRFNATIHIWLNDTSGFYFFFLICFVYTAKVNFLYLNKKTFLLRLRKSSGGLWAVLPSPDLVVCVNPSCQNLCRVFRWTVKETHRTEKQSVWAVSSSDGVSWGSLWLKDHQNQGGGQMAFIGSLYFCSSPIVPCFSSSLHSTDHCWSSSLSRKTVSVSLEILVLMWKNVSEKLASLLLFSPLQLHFELSLPPLPHTSCPPAPAA